MPTFRYSALTRTGAKVEGTLEAASQAVAIRHIQELGHLPIAAELTASDKRGLQFRGFGPRTRQLPDKALSEAFGGLAKLLEAGVPLDQALGLLAQIHEDRRVKPELENVLQAVKRGRSLADAMAARGESFPRMAIGMVRAGDMGGTPGPALHGLAEFLAKSDEIRERIRSAMVYPTILMGVAILSIFVILFYVMPQFEPIILGAGKSPPAITRAVLAVSRALREYWAIWVAALTALIVASRLIAANAGLRHRADTFRLRLPLLGNIVRKSELGRFAHTLGTLLQNGTVLHVALPLAMDTVENARLRTAVEGVAARLKEGRRFAALLADDAQFPVSMTSLIKVGEESGKLDEMLLRVADLYQEDSYRTIERSLTLLAPLITLILGLIVALVVASMLMAILSLNEMVL